MATGAPIWDGRPHTLRDFLWRLEWCFDVSGITEAAEKVKWAVSYVEPSIRDEWSSFEEFTTPDWEGFKQRLKAEYPEIVQEEKGSVSALRSLCGRFKHISQYDEERLLDFKRKFSMMATKCLTDPALVTNRELVEMFVGSLDKNFQDSLNNRLSTSGTLRGGNKVRDEDPYDWTEVVKTAVELVSGKTIAKAFKADSAESVTRATPAQVKREPSTSQLEQEDWRAEMASLKDTMDIRFRSIQSFMDSQRSAAPRPSRPAGNSGYGQQQSSQGNDDYSSGKCFYCYETGHRWMNCPVKDQDIKEGKVKLIGRELRYGDGSPIPRENGMSMKAIIEKHMPTFLLSCLGLLPELPQDEEVDPITRARAPEISIYTNQLRDVRDTLIQEGRQARDRTGQDMDAMARRLASLEERVVKQPDPRHRKAKELEVSSSEDENEVEGLAAQLAKLLAGNKKKESSRKPNSGF